MHGNPATIHHAIPGRRATAEEHDALEAARRLARFCGEKEIRPDAAAAPQPVFRRLPTRSGRQNGAGSGAARR